MAKYMSQDLRLLHKDMEQLVAQESSLENWINNNPAHPDFEKVNRQLNIVRAKLMARRQHNDRISSPKKYADIGNEYAISNLSLGK